MLVRLSGRVQGGMDCRIQSPIGMVEMEVAWLNPTSGNGENGILVDCLWCSRVRTAEDESGGSNVRDAS